MKPNRIVKAWIAVICSIALVGGGAALMSSPASAQASINWKHIWKTQIKPRADKRYYKKSTANGLFARVGSSYTKAESDAKYTPTGTAFTKAESDARYAPAPGVIRGTMLLFQPASAAGQPAASHIDFGWTFPAAPTVHIIAPGATPPAGCSGTPAAPNAAPGNLCVFERFVGNSSGITTCSAANVCGSAASAFGAWVFATATAPGTIDIDGSWAAAPAGPVTASRPILGQVVHSGPTGR